MGAQLGSSVAFGSGCGQALPGVPRERAKRYYVYLNLVLHHPLLLEGVRSTIAHLVRGLPLAKKLDAGKQSLVLGPMDLET